MSKLKLRIVEWLLHSSGFKFVALKAEEGTTTIEGDKDLLKYVDVSGFFFKKEPLKRFYKKFNSTKKPFQKLNKEQLKEVGL